MEKDLMEIVKKIPMAIRIELAERIVDLLLNSKKAELMPSGLAKTILYYWQRDQLTSDTGIEKLLEAGIILEPEITVTMLNELKLEEIARMVEDLLKTAK